MHVCLVSVEFFGFGCYGGFGRAVRIIGRELVRRGVRVTVIVPRRGAGLEPRDAEVDGMRVAWFSPTSPTSAWRVFRSSEADVFHSQEPSMGTWLAASARPDRRHVVTFRYPLSREEWRVERGLSGIDRFASLKYRLFMDNPLVGGAVRKADGLYCAAPFLASKVMRKYRLRAAPEFLPTPVRVPEQVEKSLRPTVCFVGRFHPRKRPELFFELARDFPDVEFIAVGEAEDKAGSLALRRKYSSIPNLELTGAINQFESDRLSRILAKSWVLVNTSPLEGLPIAFIEAAAHRCAILSFLDPGGFVSRFGRQASTQGLRAGLEELLENDRWRELGERGCAYVRVAFGMEPAMDAHLEAYRRALSGR